MRRRPFTRLTPFRLALGLVAAALLFPGTALADRVVLLRPTGSTVEERVDAIDEALTGAVQALGHEALTESGVRGNAPPPETGNEMRAIGEMQNAEWTVVPRITSMQAGRYRMILRVGHTADGRVEELEVSVYDASQSERLRDVLGAMLRPEGVGEDALRLTEEPEAPPANVEDEAERAHREAEEREHERAAREEFLARERERAEEERRRAQESWDGRERYGQRGQWMIGAGFDLRPLITSNVGNGGLLLGVSVRLGRSFEGLPGFEVRATADVIGGSTSAFALTAGAVYLHSFFDVPVFIGLGIDLGWFQAFTGDNSPSFLLRAAPTVAWRVVDDFWLEVGVGEIMFSTSQGALTTGVSLRVAFRF